MTALCLFMTNEQIKKMQVKNKGKGMPAPSLKEMEKVSLYRQRLLGAYSLIRPKLL